MSTLRPLLALGNGKLGRNIYHWSLPAVESCPGRSSVCEGVCYARSGRFRTSRMGKRLKENLDASKAQGFAERMIAEIRRRWVQVCRVHVAGDFYSVEYARSWLLIFRACNKVRFYAYTRSWRVPEIEPLLVQMARLSNVRLWYSADRETGEPPSLPRGVRVAWLLDRKEEAEGEPDLVFVVRPLRKEFSRLSLPLICPTETAEGKSKGLDCGSCGKCWR